MSDIVLAQLQQVEAELLTQEEQITAQIESLQEKLSGIRTVVTMYSGETDDVKSSSSTSAKPKKTAPSSKAGKSPAAKKASTSKGAVTEKKAKEPTVSKAATAKQKTKKTTAGKAPTAKQKKKDGRVASWQKYTRPGVKNESIPDAVQLVLKTQPDKDFKIAEVMTALFKENMPKSEYLKARNRISNVLSGGVRAGDWFKGARGTYRMTKA